MMNWALILFGLAAFSNAITPGSSCGVTVPGTLLVGQNNALSICIPTNITSTVNVKFELTVSNERVEKLITCNPGSTCSTNMHPPGSFPTGPGQLTVTATGGWQFTKIYDVNVLGARLLLMIQTSASTYRPSDTMEIRVIGLDNKYIALDQQSVDIEIYDAAMKLVSEFPNTPIQSGLTETLRVPIDEHPNLGRWMVSATIANQTSSVEVLVSRPVTPSFDLKGIFQRFLLRTDKYLQGAIEIANDENTPIFGRAIIAIGQMTEQDLSSKEEQQNKNDEWRQWKSQQMEIAGRVELNYDLQSVFNIDLNKALAIQIYIQVTDLASGQDRIIRHLIPVFNREIIYDIRPLQFEAGTNNEYEVIAKRLDGKPIKMEDMIVTVRMFLEKEKENKVVEIKDFYTRGRNDIGFFNIEYPENCIGVHMTITPLDESGKVSSYRTRSMALMPRPRSRGGKLSIELLPSKDKPVRSDAKTPVISSQIPTVGDQPKFYIQVLPSKSITTFERLPMSYVVMTNGRRTASGEFFIEPTKECQNKAVRDIHPEEPQTPMCVFNGTLSFEITEEMIPYSTLIVYSFQQKSFGFMLAESYRFSVAGLFQNPLTLNATMVPYKPMEIVMEPPSYLKDMNLKPIRLSEKVQDKTRVELTVTGEPDSIVGINVFEADGILQGLSNEMTKERLLQYLTQYENLPLTSFPMKKNSKRHYVEEPAYGSGGDYNSGGSYNSDGYYNKGGYYKKRTVSEEDEEQQIRREQMGYQMRYPIEKMIFGLNTRDNLPPLEGDDAYTVSTLGRFYGDAKIINPSFSSQYSRKMQNSLNQYDVTVDNSEFVIATSMPLVFTANPPVKTPSMKSDDQAEAQPMEEYGTAAWYEEMNKEINSIPQELSIFMRFGLNLLQDGKSLGISQQYHTENRNEYFPEYHQPSFNLRDRARQYFEEYVSQSNYSMIVPPIMLEEQARIGYYRSIFFNTTRIGPQGTAKIVLPPLKPYSTWLASAFAMKSGSSISIAEPIRLPTSQGLYLLANCPRQIQTGERVLLSYGVNNYLGKDLSNVVVRIRASNDFDLMEQNKPEQMISIKDKDYSMMIPSMKSMAVETRHMIVVPKRSGLIQIVMEVESEFGGDSEIVTFYVRDSEIQRREYSTRLFDLTAEKKTFGPFITKIEQSPALRSVRFAVSGTGLDRFVRRYTMEINSLIGIDRTLARLYRSLGLRQYLNETSQTTSPLFNMTSDNITTAYQRLQLYQDYDGSYSFVSDEGTKYSSLYLTSLAFGAMIHPMMPFRDNVVLNRTLEWILSHQQEDGSFDDQEPCFHDRFCKGKFHRESLTAIVLYSLTRDNATECYPQFIAERLLKGDKNPLARAQSYLISRVPDVITDYMTISLFEMAFIQNPSLPSELREKIHKALTSRKLTTVPEDNSRFMKTTDETMSLDDQLLLNAMTVSLYAHFKDYRTTSDIARWVVSQIEIHPYYDTLLDAVFRTSAWLNTGCLFRKQFAKEKFEIFIDVSADNGEKRQLKIDSMNMDSTQKMTFSLPVKQITYSVRGFGLASIRLVRTYAEPKQQIQEKTLPFEMTNEFVQMPWFSEVKCKACMTYKPMGEKLNRTIVLEYQIPSGTRVNIRQIGFYLSRVEQVMYFTYEPCGNKLIFFINVPPAMFGKSICLEWMIERLSTVMTWSPVQLRLYDYLEPEMEMIQRFPVQFQPNYLGYAFVDAIEKARPNLPSFKANQS